MKPANGVGVIINSSGQLGTIQSSAWFKEAIKPMDKASEASLFLKSVTFRYKEELDSDEIPQFGLIAEQVEKVTCFSNSCTFPRSFRNSLSSIAFSQK